MAAVAAPQVRSPVHQTGLVIVLAEAQARFGALRQRFDPQAALGVPAHVTILFPFMAPTQIHAQVRARLAGVFAQFAPFACVFDRVERFPATAYLAPAVAHPFVELTAAVAREFPDYPPYAGAHAAFVPHLTIADGDAEAAALAERELRADLERHGPLSARCRCVTLLENTSGRWREQAQFALSGRRLAAAGPATAPLNLRRATAADAAPIEALVAAAYENYVPLVGRKPKPMLADYRVAVERHQCWVNEQGRELTAVLELIPSGDHMLLENVAVHPSVQRSGLGQALVAFAEVQARQQGFSQVRLYTNERFPGNVGLYARLGYRETHRETFRGTPVVHMAKDL